VAFVIQKPENQSGPIRGFGLGVGEVARLGIGRHRLVGVAPYELGSVPTVFRSGEGDVDALI
jgi:hypothetical protein